MATPPVPPAFLLPWATTPDGRPTMLTPTAQGFLQGLFSASGSTGAVAWSTITGIPANVTALAGLIGGIDKVPYFTFAGAMAVADFTALGRSLVGAVTGAAVLALISPLTTKGDIFAFSSSSTRLGVGANGQVLTADSTQPTGLKWAPASASGLPPPYLPLTFYGAVENGVTDDAAAISAWLADAANHTVWIESLSANSLSTPRLLNKRARGTGNYHFTATGDYVPAAFAWITVKPAVSALPVGSSNYNFGGDLSLIDARYTILGRLTAGGNIRRSLTEAYYESVVTPHWEQLNNLSGWSGVSCRLSVALSAGLAACTVNSTAGITTGDTIGFYGPSGNILESRVVTVIGPNTLQWTGGLANNYPLNTALTQGLRTMDPISYMEVNHFGGGDSYGTVYVVGNGYQKTAGQQHWVETATVGALGGSVSFSADMVYATGFEFQYSDNGHDVNVIADVESFTRTNQIGAGGTVWGRDWTQSTGIDASSGQPCPIDWLYTAGGWSRCGLDFSRMLFTGATADPAVQPAIQLGLGHRIYFNSTITAGGRGTDPRGIYAGMYGNTPGDMYLGSGNDGVSDVMDWKFDRAGGSRIRLRPDSINFNNAANFGSQIHVSGNLILASGGFFHNIGPAVYWNNGVTDTYIAG